MYTPKKAVAVTVRRLLAALGLLVLTSCNGGVPTPPPTPGIEDHGAFLISADARPRAVLEQALKAHGGADKFSRWKAGVLRYSTRGQFLPGLPPGSLVEDWFQLPGHFKRAVYSGAFGELPTLTVVINKGKGWRKHPDEPAQAFEDKITEQPAHPFVELYDLRQVLGPDIELTRLEDEQISGAATAVIHAEGKDLAALDLYINRKTGLLVLTSKEVPTDKDGLAWVRVQFESYRDVQGGPVPTHVTAQLNGRDYFELSLFEVRFVEQLDEQVFAKP